MKKISIITPMYNSFDMMGRNLDVLSKQTAAMIELIIVDDCSTDDSFARALSFAQKSSFDIKVIQNTINSGPGVSRNLGLSYATGDYITFADSDDYFSEDFTFALSPLLDQDVDCLVFDYKNVDENGEEISRGRSFFSSLPINTIVDKNEALVYVHGSPWGKIYKRKLIQENNVRFGEYYRNEDMPFTKCAIAMSQNVYYLSKHLYMYTQSHLSLMHNNSLTDEKNCQRAFALVYQTLSPLGFEEELRAIEVKEVLNNTVLIKIQKKERRSDIIKYIKSKYKTGYFKNKYFHKYELSTRVVAYCAFLRTLIFLRILIVLKQVLNKQ